MEQVLLAQLRKDLGLDGVADPLPVDLLLSWRAMQGKELLDPGKWTILWLALVWIEKKPQGVSVRLAYQTIEALWRLTRMIFYQFSVAGTLPSFRAKWFRDFVEISAATWATVPYCETLVAVPCTGLAPLTRVPWPIPPSTNRFYWLCQAVRSGHGQAILASPSNVYTEWTYLLKDSTKYNPSALRFIGGGKKVDKDRNLFYLAMYKAYRPNGPSGPMDHPENLAQEIQISGVDSDDPAWLAILAEAYTVWPWAVCTERPFVM